MSTSTHQHPGLGGGYTEVNEAISGFGFHGDRSDVALTDHQMIEKRQGEKPLKNGGMENITSVLDFSKSQKCHAGVNVSLYYYLS